MTWSHVIKSKFNNFFPHKISLFNCKTCRKKWYPTEYLWYVFQRFFTTELEKHDITTVSREWLTRSDSDSAKFKRWETCESAVCRMYSDESEWMEPRLLANSPPGYIETNWWIHPESRLRGVNSSAPLTLWI